MRVRAIDDAATGQRLIIDPNIPGQIGWEALIAMARLAKRVPPNGVVVETGSLFGRSSFVWAKNVHPSVTVHCIDPWIREKWIIDIVEKPQKPEMPFSLDAFRHYTRDCPNKSTNSTLVRPATAPAEMMRAAQWSPCSLNASATGAETSIFDSGTMPVRTTATAR